MPAVLSSLTSRVGPFLPPAMHRSCRSAALTNSLVGTTRDSQARSLWVIALHVCAEGQAADDVNRADKISHAVCTSWSSPCLDHLASDLFRFIGSGQQRSWPDPAQSMHSPSDASGPFSLCVDCPAEEDAAAAVGTLIRPQRPPPCCLDVADCRHSSLSPCRLPCQSHFAVTFGSFVVQISAGACCLSLSLTGACRCKKPALAKPMLQLELCILEAACHHTPWALLELHQFLMAPPSSSMAEMLLLARRRSQLGLPQAEAGHPVRCLQAPTSRILLCHKGWAGQGLKTSSDWDKCSNVLLWRRNGS